MSQTFDSTVVRKSKITLKDVAKEADVNFTLVSKMLTNNPNARISKETRKRIEAAIEKLGYRPSASARALRNGRSRAVGMVVRDLTNAYFAHVANAALKLFGSRGYQLLIALDDGGDAAVQSLLQRDVDGILYLGSNPPDAQKIPVPLVLNDCLLDGAYCVNIDFEPALETALSQFDRSAEIAGLFFESSLWNNALARVARKLCFARANSYTLQTDLEMRREKLAEICAGKPDVFISSGWHTTGILVGILERKASDYSPKIIVHANCAGAFQKADGMRGAVFSSTAEMLARSCEILVDKIENKPTQPAKIPATYIDAEDGQFSALTEGEFRLT